MEHTNTSQQNTYISDVLRKIKAKEISIHSKTFFRLKWLAFVVLVTAICIVSIALCSFILFTIRVTGQPYLLEFGSKGIELAFIIFPWMLFLIDGILVILLGSLTRHTSFGYKIPGIYVLVAAIGIIGVSGYLVDAKTSFHRSMLEYADHKRLPLLNGLYKNVRRAPPEGYEIYRGVVVSEDNDLIKIDIDSADGIGTTSTVFVRMSATSSSCAMNCYTDVHIGQTVFIAGKIVNGQVIEAELKHAPRLPPPR